jgi:glutamine amidotransferase
VERAGIAVLDYGAGNIKSVENALAYLGAELFVTSDPAELLRASTMIFPGDGEAAATMAVLSRTGLDEAIKEFARSGKKMLGICIGCQVIFETSEERNARCLGLIEGTVRRFPRCAGLKVPHMGWNQVRFKDGHPILRGIPQGASFYFVHSYFPVPARNDVVLAETEYGVLFPSAIAYENLIAFQFHPEKSGQVGLKLLGNFLEWNP